MKEGGSVDRAITMITSCDVPLTTSEIIHRLGLDANEGIYLRRVLAELTQTGVIRKLPPGPDGSHSWITGDVAPGRRLAHVLNIYLSGESEVGHINPDVFQQLYESMEEQLYETTFD